MECLGQRLFDTLTDNGLSARVRLNQHWPDLRRDDQDCIGRGYRFAAISADTYCVSAYCLSRFSEVRDGRDYAIRNLTRVIISAIIQSAPCTNSLNSREIGPLVIQIARVTAI